MGRGQWGERGQDSVWGGECEETGGLCFYLRDCNNNHTSATGLVASIILSTVEQKCMGVKTILVWVCVDACVCVFVCLKEKRGELKLECTVVECVFTYSSSSHALPQTGNTPLPLLCAYAACPPRQCENTYVCVCVSTPHLNPPPVRARA